MRHVFEHAEVMLDVDYTPGEDGVPTFNDIRVMGADYKPVGPNLVGLLDSAFFITKFTPGQMEAESFLSAIAGEIY